MFNNRHSRRRFRLGNLARLVQLRQSVSHQPPQPPSPPKTLQENLSGSPLLQSQSQHSLPAKTNEETLSQTPPKSPPFQRQPQHMLQPPPSPKTNQETVSQLPPKSPSFRLQSPSKQFSPADENHGSPPHVSPESKSSSLSKPTAAPMSKPDVTHMLSPTAQPIAYVHPPPLTPPPPPSKLNTSEESMSQSSILESAEFQPPTEAKILPSTLNASEDSQSPSQTQSKSYPPPKPTLSLSESGQQSRYQTHSSPPPLSSLLPEASQNLQTQSSIVTATQPQALLKPPKLLLPQTKPPESFNTELHTIRTDQNHNTEASLVTENKDSKTEIISKARGNVSWSEKQTTMMVMMFVNSNVQGINMSLSLDSSSVDNEPGVHFTFHQ